MAEQGKPTSGNGSASTVQMIQDKHVGGLQKLHESRLKAGRTDSWYNTRSRAGGRADPVIVSRYVRSRNRLNREEAEVLYEFDWLSARVVDQMAKDATREWLSFKHDNDPDKAEAIRKEDKRLNGAAMFKEGITWGNLHGSSLMVVGAFDGTDPENPLTIESIRKIMFTHVVDRWLAFPADWYNDPDEELFGKVKIYRIHRLSLIGSPISMVHESRVIRFDGNSLSPLARIRNWGWGASVLDKVYDALRQWGISQQAAASVIPSFITVAMQIGNLQQLIQNKDFATIQARMAEFASQMATHNMAFYGDGEKLEKLGTPVTGLPDLMEKFMQIVSGAADIPKSILFQAETGGLGGNAANTDQDNWFNKVKAYQEVVLNSKVRRWIDMIGVPIGLKPGEIEFEWLPLKQPTPSEQAELYLKTAQADQILINTGMVDAPERLGIYRMGGEVFNPALPVVNTERMEKFLDELEKEPIVAMDPRAEDGQGLEHGAADLEGKQVGVEKSKVELEQAKTGFDNEGSPEDQDKGKQRLNTLEHLDEKQRDELSEKIKKLMAEGKPQDQAVAIAHNMLGLSRDGVDNPLSEPVYAPPAPRTMSIRAHRDPVTGDLLAQVQEGVGGTEGKHDVEPHHVQHPGSKGGYIVGWTSKGEPIYGKKPTAKTSMKEFSHEQAVKQAAENPHESPPLPLPHPPPGIKLNTVKHQIWAQIHASGGEGVSMKTMQDPNKSPWNFSGTSQYGPANVLVEKGLLYKKGDNYFLVGMGDDSPGTKPQFPTMSETADGGYTNLFAMYTKAADEIAPHHGGDGGEAFNKWVTEVYTPASEKVSKASKNKGGAVYELIKPLDGVLLSAAVMLSNLSEDHSGVELKQKLVDVTNNFSKPEQHKELAGWVSELLNEAIAGEFGIEDETISKVLNHAVSILNNNGYAVEGVGKEPTDTPKGEAVNLKVGPSLHTPKQNLVVVGVNTFAQTHAQAHLNKIIETTDLSSSALKKIQNRTNVTEDVEKLAAWHAVLSDALTSHEFNALHSVGPSSAGPTFQQVVDNVLAKLQSKGMTVEGEDGGAAANKAAIAQLEIEEKLAAALKPVSVAEIKAAAHHNLIGTGKAILGEKTGEQAGSNPGGKWKGTDGVERYIKEYSNPVQSYTEAITNNIYRRLSINAPNSQVFSAEGGNLHFASDILPTKHTFQEKAPTVEHAKEFMDGFGADMWLANWDAVGLDSDNVVVMPSGGVARIDQGGSLLFRAQGGDKPESALENITEWDNFFTKNPAYKKVAAKAGINKAEDALPQVEAMLERIDKLRLQTNDFEELVPGHPNVPNSVTDKIKDVLRVRHVQLQKKVTQAKTKIAEEIAAVEAAKPKPIPKPSGVPTKAKGKVVKPMPVTFYDHGDFVATKPEVFDFSDMAPVLEARKPPPRPAHVDTDELAVHATWANSLKTGKGIIGDWKGSSGSINSAWYKGNVQGVFKSVPLLKALENAPKWTGPMWRGMGLDQPDYENLMRGVVENARVKMDAPQGFSRKFSIAKSFGETAQQQWIIFHVTKSKTGRMIEDVGTSFKAEAEIIAIPGTQYKVTAYEEERVGPKLRTHIYMEEK